jgi:hypothetical protein
MGLGRRLEGDSRLLKADRCQWRNIDCCAWEWRITDYLLAIFFMSLNSPTRPGIESPGARSEERTGNLSTYCSPAN